MSILPSDAPRRSRPTAPSPVVIALIVLVLVALAGGAYALTRPAAGPAASSPPVKVKTLVTPQGTPTNPSAPAAPELAAQATLAKAEKAALTAGWARFTSVAKRGGIEVTTAQTSGIRDGSQQLHVGAATVNVLAIADRVFVSGNTAGLRLVYGASQQSATTWGSKWLRLLPGDKRYADARHGVTLESALDSMHPRTGLVLVAERSLNGKQVFGVRGRGAVASPVGSVSTLWIASDTYLPVEFDASSPDGVESITVSFSKWAVAEKLSLPTNLVEPGSLQQSI